MPSKAIISHGQPQRIWLPDLTPKQFEVFQCFTRINLCHGPRASGKSLGILHKLARHLWDNQGACAIVIGKTLKNAKVGSWKDLTQTIIPQWIASGIGMKWITPPSMEADTKMCYARVSNRYGGSSEVQLGSLEHEADCESKYRDTRYSFIYLVEGDKHRCREPYEVLSLQLRSLTVPDEQCQLWICSNPPPSARRHWLWDVFMNKSGMTDEDAAARDQINQIHFTLEDNPKAPPGLISQLKSQYRYDKAKYARLVLGEWVEDSDDGHFADVLRPEIHFVGSATSRDKSQWETIVPPETTYEVLEGWDLGDCNHSMVMVCKRIVDGQAQFDVFDELVSVDKHISLEDFTMAVLEKRDKWETYMREVCGQKHPLKWQSWSDNSALRFRSALGSHEQLEVLKLSDGRIRLHGAFKGKGAIGERISLVKKLLFENRLFISADCFHTQDMLRGLRAGAKKIEMARPDQIEHGSIFKHCFDSLTYCLAEEAPQDVEYSSRPLLRRTGSNRTGLISISL